MGRMGSGLEEANPPIEVEEKSENDLVVEEKHLKLENKKNSTFC
jgi:hypothetical protein